MYDDIKVAPAEIAAPDSPFVDKLREYIDLERAIERRQSEAHRIEKQNAEDSAHMVAIRRELLGYLEPDRSVSA